MKDRQSQTPRIYSGSEHPSSYIHYLRYHLGFSLCSILEYSRVVLHKLTTQTFVIFWRSTNQLLVLHRDHKEPLWFFGDPQTKLGFTPKLPRTLVVFRRPTNQNKNIKNQATKSDKPNYLIYYSWSSVDAFHDML